MALDKMGRFKNKALFALLAIVTGALVGALVWAFLTISEYGQELLWELLPQTLDLPFYTLAVCLIGGLLIGLLQKRFGAYPQSMDEVLYIMKRDGRYPYKNTAQVVLMALLPLLFGASIGPEAGLTGVIVGLCYWAGDRFKAAGSYMRELSQIGVSATLGVVFGMPLFGFMLPIEASSDAEKSFEVPKTAKTVVYLLAIFGGLGIYMLLSRAFGGGMSMPRFTAAAFSSRELLFAVPVAAIGAAGGLLFLICEKFIKRLFAPFIGKRQILCALAGGLALGLCAMYVPYSMFSGETQMAELTATFAGYSGAALLLIGAVKLVLTNVCIQSGWRGGHFFPIIFAGVSLGYGASLLFSVDPTFCVAISAATLLGVTMRKPFAVALLLLLCFPVANLIYLVAAAFIGSIIPLPRALKKAEG